VVAPVRCLALCRIFLHLRLGLLFDLDDQRPASATGWQLPKRLQDEVDFVNVEF